MYHLIVYIVFWTEVIFLYDCKQNFRSYYVAMIYTVLFLYKHRGCRDRMVVGFTITCAISAYHH